MVPHLLVMSEDYKRFIGSFVPAELTVRQRECLDQEPQLLWRVVESVVFKVIFVLVSIPKPTEDEIKQWVAIRSYSRSHWIPGMSTEF
jgi:hypothetical protein